MAGHEWEDWFEREEFIAQISDIRVQNLQVEREEVQKRTFTRWINLHLEKCDPPIEVQDLFHDIQDGRVLMALLEELSGCKMLPGFKKSSHRIFRLNNIAKVLSFLEERNVKLVSIDAADVADGNSSIILGLIWNIILFFQIKELTGNIRSQFPSSSSLSSIPTSSDSDVSYGSAPSDERPSDERPSASAAMREHGKAIKKLLQWVQKRTRRYGVAVHDFGKSWSGGLAFLAVIKSIDSSLIDMRKALLRNARENLEDAFRIAHYSLGIPRLLEPEDLLNNAPDEQSIIIYVSQFLEYFPGIEEPEEPQRVIERSISMGRLNFRDNDAELRSNGIRSRVKETSYRFQRECVKRPPKILISSVSEDRSAASPPFVPAAARSFSAEDILAETQHVEDISTSAAEIIKDPAVGDKMSSARSPTGSSAPECVHTESVLGDSAVGSPVSWVESDYGAMSEKLCKSQSDSSLCDSETAWDVYHAIPADVTNHDEGFELSADDREEQSYNDQGIGSITSLERAHELFEEHAVVEASERDPECCQRVASSQELTKQHSDKTEVEEQTEKPPENHDMEQDQVSNKDSSQMDERIEPCVEDVPDPCDQIIKQMSVESVKVCHEEAAVKPGHEQEGLGRSFVKEGDEDLVERQDGACLEERHPQERRSTDSVDIPVNSIPLISISEEPEEQSEEKPPEVEIHRQDTSGLQETEPVISVSPNPHEVDADLRGNVDISCACLDYVQLRDSSNNHEVDLSEAKWERDLLQDKAETDASKMDSTGPADGGSQLVGSDQDKNGNTEESVNKTETSGVDFLYADFDRASPTEDVVSDVVEPMDLFYPDKEESVFAEPLDTEMQSWPSVLSVSALQPAPASQTPVDDQLLYLLDEDAPGGETGNTTDDNGEAEVASESHEEPVLSGGTMGGAWLDVVPPDLSGLTEATDSERNLTGFSCSDDERLIPVVLRQRKGARLLQTTDNDGAAAAAPGRADTDTVCWTDRPDLFLLILLWLLLYCLLLLPQMDWTTLPDLLLNFKH